MYFYRNRKKEKIAPPKILRDKFENDRKKLAK